MRSDDTDYRYLIINDRITTLITGISLIYVIHNFSYYVDSNGLPDHETQVFNPNVETEQDHFFKFSKNPTFACSPSCLPGGTIGITKQEWLCITL